MKIAALIARVLLGIMFTVFGLNGFFHFLPQPPLPPGPASAFLGAMGESHYMVPIFALQLVAGLLFLSGRYLPLALTLIAPVIVNILLYHGLMDPKGLPPGLVAAVLWAIIFASVRSAFAGILQPTVPLPAPER